MREAVRYDLSYSVTDSIIRNCSYSPSLQNSKAKPLITNIENQRCNCKDIIIMYILCGRMVMLYLAPVFFFALHAKHLIGKGKILLEEGRLRFQPCIYRRSSEEY